MFGRKKSVPGPTSSPSQPQQGVEVVGRGEDERTQQPFNFKVTVHPGGENEVYTVTKAVAEEYGVEHNDFRLDVWSRKDGRGPVHKGRGR